MNSLFNSSRMVEMLKAIEFQFLNFVGHLDIIEDTTVHVALGFHLYHIRFHELKFIQFGRQNFPLFNRELKNSDSTWNQGLRNWFPGLSPTKIGRFLLVREASISISLISIYVISVSMSVCQLSMCICIYICMCIYTFVWFLAPVLPFCFSTILLFEDWILNCITTYWF